MAKNNDVPKDKPVLTPPGRRPSLKELAETSQEDPQVARVVNGKKVQVAAFNSSI